MAKNKTYLFFMKLVYWFRKDSDFVIPQKEKEDFWDSPKRKGGLVIWEGGSNKSSISRQSQHLVMIHWYSNTTKERGEVVQSILTR